jgi:ubiquinone/menaquinone biosynthesis C-methylase UbiE
MFSEPQKNLSQFHIDPGMKIADLGSGVGYYALLLAEKVGPSGKVYAFDVQKDLLEKIKKDVQKEKMDNVEVFWCDLDEENSTMLNDRFVDRVVITNTLFQMEKKDVFLGEAYRILKPKGKMLLIDWTDSFSGIGPKFDEVIKPDVARVMCQDLNFIFEKEINAGDHHYGFVFSKN